MFSGAVQSGEVGAGCGFGAGADGEARDPAGDASGACDAAHAQDEEADEILEALKRVVDEQTSEIAQICRCAAS